MTESKSVAGDLEAAAQEELQEIVDELKEIERRLRAVHQSLPAPADVETEDEKDASAEIRSVIECVLLDSLGPAIRDLQAAALPVSGDRGKDPGRSGGG